MSQVPFAQRHDIHEMAIAGGIYVYLTSFKGESKDVALANALGVGTTAYLYMVKHGHDPSKLFSTLEGLALLTTAGFYVAETFG